MAGREKKSGTRKRPVNLESPPATPSATPTQRALQGTAPLQGNAPSTLAAAYASWRPESSAGNHGVQPTSANPWGSYFNSLQQTVLPPMQANGENSHFVGVAKSMNTPSPTTTATTTKGVKKRFWSHDEEVRLASAWLNTSKDPIHGNDKNRESFWGQITEKFNKDSQC
ncbi:unnamed protein product [Urochloa decumbens]|uniref:Myb-like domain-containing protein n=1 Tax=Urochloa decumbens TaxID=240449 RepID=A0ABC9FQF7_9POAL